VSAERPVGRFGVNDRGGSSSFRRQWGSSAAPAGSHPRPSEGSHWRGAGSGWTQNARGWGQGRQTEGQFRPPPASSGQYDRSRPSQRAPAEEARGPQRSYEGRPLADNPQPSGWGRGRSLSGFRSPRDDPPRFGVRAVGEGEPPPSGGFRLPGYFPRIGDAEHSKPSAWRDAHRPPLSVAPQSFRSRMGVPSSASSSPNRSWMSSASPQRPRIRVAPRPRMMGPVAVVGEGDSGRKAEEEDAASGGQSESEHSELEAKLAEMMHIRHQKKLRQQREELLLQQLQSSSLTPRKRMLAEWRAADPAGTDSLEREAMTRNRAIAEAQQRELESSEAGLDEKELQEYCQEMTMEQLIAARYPSSTPSALCSTVLERIGLKPFDEPVDWVSQLMAGASLPKDVAEALANTDIKFSVSNAATALPSRADLARATEEVKKAHIAAESLRQELGKRLSQQKREFEVLVGRARHARQHAEDLSARRKAKLGAIRDAQQREGLGEKERERLQLKTAAKRARVVPKPSTLVLKEAPAWAKALLRVPNGDWEMTLSQRMSDLRPIDRIVGRVWQARRWYGQGSLFEMYLENTVRACLSSALLPDAPDLIRESIPPGRFRVELEWWDSSDERLATLREVVAGRVPVVRFEPSGLQIPVAVLVLATVPSESATVSGSGQEESLPTASIRDAIARQIMQDDWSFPMQLNDGLEALIKPPLGRDAMAQARAVAAQWFRLSRVPGPAGSSNKASHLDLPFPSGDHHLFVSATEDAVVPVMREIYGALQPTGRCRHPLPQWRASSLAWLSYPRDWSFAARLDGAVALTYGVSAIAVDMASGAPVADDVSFAEKLLGLEKASPFLPNTGPDAFVASLRSVLGSTAEAESSKFSKRGKRPRESTESINMARDAGGVMRRVAEAMQWVCHTLTQVPVGWVGFTSPRAQRTSIVATVVDSVSNAPVGSSQVAVLSLEGALPTVVPVTQSLQDQGFALQVQNLGHGQVLLRPVPAVSMEGRHAIGMTQQLHLLIGIVNHRHELQSGVKELEATLRAKVGWTSGASSQMREMVALLSSFLRVLDQLVEFSPKMDPTSAKDGEFATSQMTKLKQLVAQAQELAHAVKLEVVSRAASPIEPIEGERPVDDSDSRLTVLLAELERDLPVSMVNGCDADSMQRLRVSKACQAALPVLRVRRPESFLPRDTLMNPPESSPPLGIDGLSAMAARQIACALETHALVGGLGLLRELAGEDWKAGVAVDSGTEHLSHPRPWKEEELEAGPVWTADEVLVFLDKFFQFPKDFAKIASFLPRRRCADCVSLYYLIKHKAALKSGMATVRAGIRRKDFAAPFRQAVHSARLLGVPVGKLSPEADPTSLTPWVAQGSPVTFRMCHGPYSGLAQSLASQGGLQGLCDRHQLPMEELPHERLRFSRLAPVDGSIYGPHHQARWKATFGSEMVEPT
jgi:hypothetical protein